MCEHQGLLVTIEDHCLWRTNGARKCARNVQKANIDGSFYTEALKVIMNNYHMAVDVIIEPKVTQC